MVTLLLALAAAAPPALVEATLTEASPTELAWNSGDTGRRCRVDGHTHRELLARPLMVGDRIEAWIWEQQPGDCQVLSVRLLVPVVQRNLPVVRINLNPFDSILQRGDLHYSGTVLSVQGNRMTVMTRSEGRQIFVLRPDTHVLQQGVRINAAGIPLNHKVYVRAGRSLDGDLEAFRIAWGSILIPEETGEAFVATPWRKP